MEAALIAGLATLPNMIFAAYALWRSYQMNERLLEAQIKMSETLVALHPPQSAEDAKNIAGVQQG